MGVIKKISHTILIATLMAILFVLVSCGKRPVESKHTTERIIEHRKDSIVNREISKPIIDSLFIRLSKIKTAKPECDSITNAEIHKLLKQIASLKKSGDNELGFYFDEIQNMLVAYGKTGQSLSERIATLEKQLDKKSETIEKEIPVKYIPKWVQGLAIVGFAALVFIALWIFNSIRKKVPTV